MSAEACAKIIIDSGGDNDGQSTCFVNTVVLLNQSLTEDFARRVAREDTRHRAVRADQLHELLVAAGLEEPRGRAVPGGPSPTEEAV